MARRVPRAILAALLVSLSLGACDNHAPSRASQARATAATFVLTCALDRPLSAMRLLTEPLRDTFVRAGSPAQACARFLGIDPGGQSDEALFAAFRGTTVVSVTVGGGAALVRLAPPAAPQTAVSLEFSEGEWKVDGGPHAT